MDVVDESSLIIFSCRNKTLTAEGEAVGAVGEALVGAASRALDVAGGAPVGGAGDLVVALVVPVGDDGGELAIARGLLGVPRRRRPLGLLAGLPGDKLRRRRRRQRQQRHQQQSGNGSSTDGHCC